MTFRDYAQGAYRMRQIGEGQTLVVYLIPEVANRIREELRDADGSPSLVPALVALPAWLLLNSMRAEALQFAMLSTQEIANVWRKVMAKV